MIILVPVKITIDYKVKLRIKDDQIDNSNVKLSISAFDEIAIAKAIEWKKQNLASKVIIVNVSEKGDNNQEVLRPAFAMGVDEVIYIETENSYNYNNIAEIIASYAGNKGADLLLTGVKAIDRENGVLPAILASQLGWNYASNANKIDRLDSANFHINSDIATYQVKLPAIISCDIALAKAIKPRLPDVMKSRNKKIELVEYQSKYKYNITAFKYSKKDYMRECNFIDNLGQVK